MNKNPIKNAIHDVRAPDHSANYATDQKNWPQDIATNQPAPGPRSSATGLGSRRTRPVASSPTSGRSINNAVNPSGSPYPAR